MKSQMKFFLAQAFPVMALAGLLLAAYGLLIAPDEVQNGREIARMVDHQAP